MMTRLWIWSRSARIRAAVRPCERALRMRRLRVAPWRTLVWMWLFRRYWRSAHLTSICGEKGLV